METKNVKFVVFVPLSHADKVRQALGEAGAGKIGNYDFCSFFSWHWSFSWKLKNESYNW